MDRFDRSAVSACKSRYPFPRSGVERLCGKVLPHQTQHILVRDNQMAQPFGSGLFELDRNPALRTDVRICALPQFGIGDDAMTHPLAQSQWSPKTNLHLPQIVAVLTKIRLKARACRAVCADLQNYIQTLSPLCPKRAFLDNATDLRTIYAQGEFFFS